MITTVNVTMTIARPSSPNFPATDPRVLLAAQRVLLARPGVLQADLLPWSSRDPGPMVFVVALDDATAHGLLGQLLTGLEGPEGVTVVWAEDGGWKVQLVDLDFRVSA